MRALAKPLTLGLSIALLASSVASAQDATADDEPPALEPAWVRVGEPVLSVPRGDSLAFTDVEIADRRIVVTYPATKGRAERHMAAELVLTFNEPPAILRPGQEQPFQIAISGEVIDATGKSRSVGVTGYIHINDTEAIGNVVSVSVRCGDDVPSGECILDGKAIGQAAIKMPTIWPGFVENGARTRIGVGATPCGSCFVSYEYQARLVPVGAGDTPLPGDAVVQPEPDDPLEPEPDGPVQPEPQPDVPDVRPPAGVGTEPIPGLPGDPDEAAAGRIPRIIFEPRAEDYSTDHPDLGTFSISFNTFLVLFALDASVGEVNAVLDEIDGLIVGSLPGVPSVAQGVLIVRTPFEDHDQMSALLEWLDADPRVEVAVQDVLMEPLALPRQGGPVGPGNMPWTWELKPNDPASVAQDGNWGLEVIRAPQMWNLNAAIRKAGTGDAGAAIMTGVLDTGFADRHEAISYQNQTPGDQTSHGTHVAGTIGADHDDARGVDGVDPFAQLVVRGLPVIPVAPTLKERKASAAKVMVDSLTSLTRSRDDIAVVNISLGFNWGTAGVDQDTSAMAHEVTEGTAHMHEAVKRLDRELAADFGFSEPLLVVAAGNDSNDGFGKQDARWSSPFAFARVGLGHEDILLVESIQRTEPLRRSGFSNTGGDVSAPGSRIVSTGWRSAGPCAAAAPSCYERKSGTSMAAPHVTGLVSYLLKVDPGLSHADIHTLLEGNGVAVNDDASDHVDAFATVMAIDGLRGSDGVRRLLLDIDDGTPDGNKRTGRFEEVEDADRDGGIGDGGVDMSDFRRWRDWLLITEGQIGNLDGLRELAKNDVNANGVWHGQVGPAGTAEDESVFPRGDFNGDGKLDRAEEAFVPGRGGGGTWTDLEVLQTLFADPYYGSDDLDALVDSWDLEVSPVACLAHDAVEQVRSWVASSGSGRPLGAMRSHQLRENHIYTVAAGAAHDARLEGLDAAGNVVRVAELDGLDHVAGHDRFWSPDCTEPEPDPTPLPVPVATAPSPADSGDWAIVVLEEIHEGAAVCGGTGADPVTVQIQHRIVYEAYAPLERAEKEVADLLDVDRPTTWTLGGCGAQRWLAFSVEIEQIGLTDDEVRAFFDAFKGVPELFRDGSGPLKAWLVGDRTGTRPDTKGTIWAESAE